MMKGLYRFTILSFIALSQWSCDTRNLDGDESRNCLVQIEAPHSFGFRVPGSSAATKAGSDVIDDLFIKTDDNFPIAPSNMPKGSTLWLLIEEPGQGYSIDPADSRYEDPMATVPEPESWKISDQYSYKPYIVGDNSAMYPCETRDSVLVKDDGKEYVYRVLDRDAGGNIKSSGGALMLPPGLYRFHAVSPATALLTLIDGESQPPMVHLSNGQYVLATDVRWKETYPKSILIRGGTGVSGIQSIALPALVNQTSRIKLNIRCGDNVEMLDVQDSGIEISGIQEDPKADFKWTLDETIKTRIGNKYEGMILREYEKATDPLNGRDMITAYASILPTDARANTIYLMFHLIVNDVPTQYMVGLTNQLYESANEYEFNFRVNMNGDIAAGTWDNNTLVYEDLELL